jgi:hypothetical protein
MYAGASIPTINMDALVYFAMSIFWRASLRKWKTVSGHTDQLKLGAAQEDIRTFRSAARFRRLP